MKLQDYEVQHMARLREIVPECMVLLKSDGSFPLTAAGDLALYGNAARKTIKGGTGSGDVNVRSFVTIEEGLENAGFTITTKGWLDAYDAVYAAENRKFKAAIKARIAREGFGSIMLGIGAIMTEPDYDLPLDGEGDTAIYVLGRISGEGSDRTTVEGDFQMTQTEIRDILKLQRRYQKFMLVLNVGGPVDLRPVAEQVSNILLLSQVGMTIGDSLADVLLGKAYPSGKLTTTWASWEDYCHEGDFGNEDDTRYREGIYVGYRYFNSVGKKPLFPFGFGMGYTSFSIKAEKISVHASTVTVDTCVTNTGNHPGKEVLQLYISIPEGKLHQPYQVLAAFGKTRELATGESEILRLSFDLRSVACFDEDTASDILESGNYVLRLGNSSDNTTVCAVLNLGDMKVVQRYTHIGGKADFADWMPERSGDGETPKNIPVLTITDVKEIQIMPPELDQNALDFVKRLTDEELAYLCTGGFEGEGGGSFIGNSGTTVAGAAGETTAGFAHLGVPNIVMADGPAGLRIARQYGVDEQGLYTLDNGSMSSAFEVVPEEMLKVLGFGLPKPERKGRIYEQNCTAIPIGTALAQSWNTTLCEDCGDIVGDEMERFGVHIWLAPALNIHRLPLCGRNFEYYSEDPLVSGKIAAAVTRGVQKHPGRGVAIKHFAANNQETNRFRTNSIVNERTLRDIYLRGFRIVIDEADPASVMSSYNLLNGEHTSQREDLLETLLRQQWGFRGIVMSDWVVPGFESKKKYPSSCSNGCIRAGNDIMMPGSKVHYENLLNVLNNDTCSYPLTREQLEKCAARMVAFAWTYGRK